MKRFFLFFCVLALGTIGVAQTNYRQRQLTMDNGLMSNAVRCVIQDERGFIWMGTDNGLSRYDGTNTFSYPMKDEEGEPVEQMITSMVCDKHGDLVIGSSLGLFRFSSATETFTPLPVELKTSVTHLTIDKDENLWIATDGDGVISYQEKEGDDPDIHVYPLRETGGKASFIFTDSDNQQWVITPGETARLLRLNKSNDRFVTMSLQQGQTASRVTTMLQASNGQRWLGTWDSGLLLLKDDGTTERMPSTAAGHYQHIRALFELSAHELLLGCDDGLWTFDTHQRTYSLYMPLRFVTTITRDHEGGLWMGALYGGVTYLSPIAHRFESTPVGLTTRFCEDPRGHVWTTNETGGLKCFRKDVRIEHYKGEEQLRNIKAHSLCMDGDDIWIGTFSEGIYVFSTTTGALRHYGADNGEHSLYDLNACTLLRDEEGTVWAVTMEGLCRYDRQHNHFDHIVQMQSVPIDLDRDQNGNLWVATQGSGIWCYKMAEKKVVTYEHNNQNEQSLSNNIVNCLFVDSKGNIWAGTQGGLCLYDPNIDNFVPKQLDMPRLTVTAITEDQCVLWISGDYGILRYDPKKGMQRFTRHDGLVSEQFQPNAAMKGSDGRIYFGTAIGFNAFYPYKIKVNQLLPAVFITEMEINNQPVKTGSWHLPVSLQDIDKVDLWYNDKVFSLEYASLSYCSPEKNIYAYILEGFDKTWNYVGHEHKATYTNLAPGTYTFRVKATNNDGIWSEKEARLVIEVHPPFWWNIYAKILYVILFISFVVLFIRFRLYMTERRHRKEMEKLNEAKQEEIRNARTEFFTTIAHEIRTPVSLIIGPLDKLKEEMGANQPATLDVIDRNAHRLLELVNQLLDFRKVESNQQELDFAPQNIKELLTSVVDNFKPVVEQHGHQFTVDYPDEQFTAVVNREGMVKVISNLLSNANKYAHDRIELSCTVLPEQKQFRIDVSDDGDGIDKEDQKQVFDPFFQAKHNKPGSGIGLSIVKKIVMQHHGTVGVRSKVGEGTTFSVLLPMAQAYSGEQKAPEKPTAAVEENTPATTPVTPEEKPVMLIVEDNEDMLTFLVTTFMDDYEVIPAHDGTEAIKILKDSLIVKDGQTPTSTVDIIISDWMMSKMDGPELCNRLRQNAATTRIPFILLTAKTDSQSKVEAMKVGVDAFIEKPFNVKYLEACIHNLLNRRIRQ